MDMKFVAIVSVPEDLDRTDAIPVIAKGWEEDDFFNAQDNVFGHFLNDKRYDRYEIADESDPIFAKLTLNWDEALIISKP